MDSSSPNELITLVGMLVGDGYEVFTTCMEAGNANRPIAIHSLIGLLAATLVVASHKVFGLITWLPDNALRWVGQMAQQMGEKDAENHVRGVVMGGVGREGVLGNTTAKALSETDQNKERAASPVGTPPRYGECGGGKNLIQMLEAITASSLRSLN